MVERVTPSLAGRVAQLSATRTGEGPRAASNGTRSEVVPRGQDQLEVSAVATLLSKSRLNPPIRQDLVDRVRGQIANGTYDTKDKLDVVIDGLLKDLNL